MFKTIVFGLLIFFIFTQVALADKGSKGSQVSTTLEEVTVPGDPIPEKPPEKLKRVWQKTTPNQSVSESFMTMGLFVPMCNGFLVPVGGGFINSNIQEGTSGRFVFKREEGEVNEKK
ncbi:MAG: hypothetical protein KBC78_02465 [Candidatus Pacebacteria bacterium]|nr:hypothetical protein [Candidatus Paceibacterota bacterium]